MEKPTDETEFTAFYESTKDAVLRAVTLARSGSREDSEDATAEAYARAYLRWQRLSTHPHPVAWVIRTALNYRISLWRKYRQGPGYPSVTHTIAGSDPLDPTLVEILRQLPRGQREVLALRVLLDLSTEQTAGILRVSSGTVKKQLHRALARLRTQLPLEDPKEAST